MNLSSKIEIACNTSLSYSVGPDNGVALHIFLFVNVCSGIFAIIGNTAVLYAVYANENLRTVSNFLLCSLAVADLLVGLVHIPFYTSLMVLHIDSKGIILKLDFLLWLQILFATTFNLCAVSIDRYIAVKMPFRYVALMTEQNCARIVALVWVLSLLFASPGAFFEDLNSWSGRYSAACSLIALLIPLFIIISCYLEILKISKHQVNRIEAAEVTTATATREQRTNRKHRKAVTTFAIITVLFIVAFTPNITMAVWFERAKNCTEGRFVFRLWTMSVFVMFISSSANPIIYGLRNKDFKTAFKRMYQSSVLRIPINLFSSTDSSSSNS